MRKEMSSIVSALTIFACASVLFLGCIDAGSIDECDADVAVLNDVSDQMFGGGDGSTGSPYLISTADQLRQFSVLVNSGSEYISAKLTSDIDLGRGSWVPIGADSYRFKGVFDGNDHTISGLSINSNAMNQALFGIVDYGIIKNLSVIGTVSGGERAAGIVGTLMGDSEISNCTFKGEVSGTDDVSGIAASISGKVVNCYNYATIKGVSTAGGVVGSARSSTITGCINYGDVSGDVTTGGVVGYSWISVVSSCTNNGAITGSHEDRSVGTGGIIGSAIDGEIGYCTNSGTIKANCDAGGIAGKSTRCTIYDCRNSGSISAIKSEIMGYHGGIAGESNGIVKNCQNSGNISSEIRVGGITGFQSNGGSVVGCYNSGNVTGTDEEIGGIVGGNFDSTVSIRECYNEGTISGPWRVGGINGLNYGFIYDCYNKGSISGDDSVGGITGQNTGPMMGMNGNGTVADCYNIGKITAKKYGGGITGTNYAGAPIINCYYLNTTASSGVPYDNGDTADGILAKTVAQFASGEVTNLLQNGRSDSVWDQKLSGSSDSYPSINPNGGTIIYNLKVSDVVDGVIVGGLYDIFTDKATLTETPTRDGYKFEGWYDLERNPFNGPVKNGTLVYAYWSSQDYGIVSSEPMNGSFNTDKAVAKIGDVVTLTVNPAEGYRISNTGPVISYGGGKVIYATGANGIYTFTMPADDVTVSVDFKPISQPADNVKLSKTVLSINEGADATLTATTSSSNSVKWSVFPEGIVDLSIDGNVATVVAKGSGTATVYAATDDGIMSCTVSVSDAEYDAGSNGTGFEMNTTILIAIIVIAIIVVAVVALILRKRSSSENGKQL